VPQRDVDATVVIRRCGVEVASWPLESGRRPDLTVADALGRLALAARQLGYSLRLRDVRADLLEVLELAGLREIFEGPTFDGTVVDGAGPSARGLRMLGEPEEGEQVRVEEVVVPDDPVA
jgi:hypothetical protein